MSYTSSSALSSTRTQAASRNMRVNGYSVPNVSFSGSLSSAFDGGNGEFLRVEVSNGQPTVYVEMTKDPHTELENLYHSQYFSFRSIFKASENDSGAATDAAVRYVLANAGDASYPSAWEGSTTFYSTNPSDPASWRRKLDTTYDSNTGELSWTHDHTVDSPSSVYFAYFPPYSYERHLSLIAKCEMAPNAVLESLGQTLDGREIECVKVGTGQKVCWIVHRQHPGENMAEFYAEGLLNRLLGLNSEASYAVDGKVREALSMYTFYIVPNMNPDGAFRGHLRTNAGGQNLNREWCPSEMPDGTPYDAPTLERSPEVFHVLQKMDQTGVDVFLDVHGDEELPYNFIAGAEGCPNWSPRLQSLQGAFLAQYSRTNSDMQVAVGYEPEEPGEGRMNVCSNQIAVRYNCLAVTLEQPFKDCMSNPDPERGWNAARSSMLGSSVLEPLVYVGPFLRTDNEFWVNTEDSAAAFGEDDMYVSPTSDYKSLL
uniref:Peptidase M14 domain-containing protein n=1 Tax=Chaetoceros debilis TaxID=122233 RepID=A0A7S3VEH8_9STRA